jgi:hypothetical protein
MPRGRALGGLAVAALAALAVLAAGAVAGCGLTVGGRSTVSTPAVATAPASRAAVATAPAPRAAARSAAVASATLARAQHTHEIPTPAPRASAPGGWHSPVQAVQVFAQAYINWTAATVARHLRVLAYVSVGQARSAMSLAAAQTARDSDLHRGGIANSGTVEAIAPVTGERNVYAVVTRERTTAANTTAYRGLSATWHVTLATVTPVDGGLWTLSGWQPES